MHIPNGMLHGEICPVTAAVSVLGIIITALRAFFSKDKPSALRFAAITALIFAGQMMNFPIKDGTSGHLLGGMLAVALLGIPSGILSMALVVTIQCLIFSDGGFTVLGANVLNMALIGAGIAGITHRVFFKKVPAYSTRYAAGLGIIAGLSIMLAALACSIELGLSGTIPFSKVVGAMLSTHALIGIGEGLITIAVYLTLASGPIRASQKRSVTVPLIASGIIAAILSPFASGFPDGLEWIAQKYQFLHESTPAFVSPLPDYTVPAINNEALATGLAGLIGVGLTFLVAWLAAKLLNKSEQYA